MTEHEKQANLRALAGLQRAAVKVSGPFRDVMTNFIMGLFGKLEESEKERAALRAALEPFAKIYDVFLDNGLDECRPDWGPVSDDYEVYCGRGGKRLITIGDLKAAKKAFGKQGE